MKIKAFIATLFIIILTISFSLPQRIIVETFSVDPSVFDNPDIIGTRDPIDPTGRPPVYLPANYVYCGTTDDGINIWGPDVSIVR